MQNKVKIAGAGFEIWKRTLCSEAGESGKEKERRKKDRKRKRENNKKQATV